MLTREYDFNVYGSDKDIIKLTAYKLYKNEEGYFEVNYDNDFTTLVLTRQADENKVKHLVDLYRPAFYEEHMTEDYTDYDDWLEYEQLTRTDTPYKISEWAKSLPAYELITLGE